MKLFILRHGIAAEHGDPRYKNDNDRPLVKEGIDELEVSTRAMKKLGLDFEVILSSPLVRARQTAEIVAAGLKIEDRLKLTDALASGMGSKPVLELIKKNYAKKGSVLIVGHEPDLSDLMAFLLSGQNNISFIKFKKGSLCKLTVDFSPNFARLNWLLTPRQMKLISPA